MPIMPTFGSKMEAGEARIYVFRSIEIRRGPLAWAIGGKRAPVTTGIRLIIAPHKFCEECFGFN